MIEILFSASLRTMIIASLTGLALAVFRVRDARLRHLCWTMVLIALITMPLLMIGLPTIEVPALPLTSQTGSSSVDLTIAPATPAPAGGSWIWLVAGLYGLVALGLIARWLVGYVLGLRLVRSAEPAAVSSASPASLAGATGTRCLESASVSVPLTFGWLRPVILLPTAFRSWDPAKLDAVIAHEEAHVRRHDFATGALASLTKAVFWLHPLAWWLEWRLSTLAEQAADDAAASRSPLEYAELLVDLAEDATMGRVQGMAIGGRSGLGQRIHRLVDPRYPNTRKAGRFVAGLAVLLLAVLSVLSATIQVTEASSPAAPQGVSHGTATPTFAPGQDDDTGDSVFRIGGGVTPPTVRSRVEPVYSEEARAERIEGTVVLDAIVRRDGSVEIVGVVNGPGFGLDQAAIEALRQWRFNPGMLNGEPVDVRLSIEVNFTLAEEEANARAFEIGEAEQRGTVITDTIGRRDGTAEIPGGVEALGGGVTAPTVASRVKPIYPVEARRARHQGTVVLDTIVHRDGTPEILGVAKGLGFGMDQAAIEALRQWRFNPGMLNGEPVDVRLSIEINFTLR